MPLEFHAQLKDVKVAREKDHRVIEIKLRAAMEGAKVQELYDLMDGSVTKVKLASAQGTLPWTQPESEGDE